MATYKTKLKAPSGLSITRKGTKITFSWKKGDSAYTDQNLKWSIKAGDASESKTVPDSKVGKNTTSKSITIDLKDYYPYTHTEIIPFNEPIPGTNKRRWIKKKVKVENDKLKSITFKVQGEQQDKKTGNKLIKSDWASKTFTVNKPLTPKVSASLSGTYAHTTTFSWSIDYGKSNASESSHIVNYFEYYTILKEDSNISDGSKLSSWSGASHDTTTGSSKTINEDVSFANDKSYTRYFKVRAVGPNGVSGWAYAHHVYATPNQGYINTATAVLNSNKSEYVVAVEWKADRSYARPIDSVTVQYAIATPASSYTDVNNVRKTTLSIPNGISPTDVQTLRDTSGYDGTRFTIPATDLGEDQCVFVRINTKHDNDTNYGLWTLVDGGYGKLPSPTGLSVSDISEDYVATITGITGTLSSITAAFVAIYYRTGKNGKEQFVGVWPAGQSSEITVKLPTPPSGSDFSLGVQSYVADYSPASASGQTGVISYSFSGNPKMKSEGIVWDNRSVPRPPGNVSVTSPREGVARVSWTWTWSDADGVELSWSDHEDAWESTDEPQKYEINATRVSAWNIAGLDVGTWYFRVRLYKRDGDSTTYGTYSSIKDSTTVKIASTPDTPVLTLLPTVVSPNGSINCYWAYAAEGDNSQAQANICEASINESTGVITYSKPIAKANDEQFKTLQVSQLGWADGSTHNLAVQIITTSGEGSNNWSTPKQVTVLTPITATITQTSLVNRAIDIDTQEGETDTVLALTNLPLEVTATGPDSSGKITYVIERAQDFRMDSPDENDIHGINGETIAIIEQTSNNTYELSTDTSVKPGTTYYTRTGSGTDLDPYIYTPVENPTGNPSTNPYYVLTAFDFKTTFDSNNLFMKFDDGCRYNLIATAEDSYGQVSEPAVVKFIVAWDHQAVRPVADVVPDNVNAVSYILPLVPEKYYNTTDTSIVSGREYYTFTALNENEVLEDEMDSYYEVEGIDYILTEDEEPVPGKTYYSKALVDNPDVQYLSTYYTKPFPGDVCDIYRLSTDKPELIVSGAEFDVLYVDPYPALGEMGGHRVVYRTINGDYITAKNEFAWVDYMDTVDIFATIIDFDGEQVVLPYDLSLSNKWSKDFTETKYLGGAVQGDWNRSISRTGSVKTKIAVREDSDLIEKMRRLAVYPGVCHVRTPDGSSYSANVEVSEDREEKKINMIADFSLDITRVDSEGFDGLPYLSWHTGGE